MQVRTLLKILMSGVLFLSLVPVSHAEYTESDLKNLFTTKKQREKIDAVRFGEHVAPTKRTVKKKIKNKKVKVSGYVTRSDGKSVVWLNNKNTMDSSRIGDVRVHQSSVGKNKKITLSLDGKTVRLKPGETWVKAGKEPNKH